jgi:hypothetical protein
MERKEFVAVILWKRKEFVAVILWGKKYYQHARS